ncbi:two-component sensor histidine kinase [Brevibacillus agri]|uniref:histidine kinase n=1 Tax=Brevibacillus agri TaxID=51101 RepID=A0A3M8B3X1_9BACL|nr:MULTISPECIES: ATP-binding protein [Brevibacillus]EJL45896.1 signal transduction histidine kinase [Brevibacillus sp. CF112]MBG9567322.1 histidine kinase [Brevibacillus agri]MBY0051995.1 HAMP domain-containing protein [Brevibacillus agri]MDN4095185.1 ATP-binding protein [Brevibacillus agri]MDR9503904.1 ATP-binding protein [Brevibacillus agri]
MLGTSKSIFRRLLFSFLATVLVGLGISGILLSFFAREYIYNSKEEELLRMAKKVNVAIHNSNKVNKALLDKLAMLDESFDTRIWLFNKEGKIVATSMKDEVFTGKSVAVSIADNVLKGKNAISELKIEGLEDPMLSVSVPWGEGENVYGGIILHAPIEGIEKTFGQMRESILWATLFGVVLSTAMVSYLSWSISRPLRTIERTAAEIGRGNYAERVQVDTHDEIADLAQTINTMAEKLEKVEQERHHLEQVRNDFLANVSHELRTPLTAIQGFLEALQDGLVEDEEARQKYYAVMYSETMQVNRLVDDLMDLMKLENNEVNLAKFPVDVAEVMNRVAFSFRQEAEEKGLQLTVEVEEELPRIYADKDRVAQILKNLVKNALKFTAAGEIRMTAKLQDPWVCIQVQDTGMGIGADDLNRIWERFFKVDRGRSKNNKGTGLGLAIVKELVELHDGKCSVESVPGQGSTFTILLPKMTAPPAKQSS